ncbi:MAG TPA: AMP-binding protein [Deltaproteobacteria bacterium]|nr:AMP-binding protein [Deltaproteobacteria bacterium]HOI05735.1 AMP-binding protein [Deltaproteobacteria bacterium]
MDQVRLQKLRLLKRAALSGARLMANELRRGTLAKNLMGMAQGDIAEDMSWADLLEEQALARPHKTFLLYRDESFTYRRMDHNANRAANFLLRLGGGKSKGIGLFMKNSPRFLDLFFGAQKIGMYIVPMNPEMKGDALKYVVEHSDISILALDAELLPVFASVAPEVLLKAVLVNDVEEESRGVSLPPGLMPLSSVYGSGVSEINPGVGYNRDDMCLIMYTSGTSGRRKGVVYRYRTTAVKKLSFMSGILLEEDDVYYTPLALIHANALFLTMTTAMARGATVALSRKFSASRFWDEVRGYGATVFNTLGSMIPILMKQPEKPTDRDNRVRIVLSAACPAEMWEPFEKRFGVKLYEGYGAVDGGGKGLVNFGTAPTGSLGRPMPGLANIRIVDPQGRDVPAGVPGELVFKARTAGSRVEYYKNEDASNEKVKDGWLYTGDLVKKDTEGFVYFVGRNTESLRRGGENVSAYEVEHVIMEHPSVEDVAVYAIPSELAEDEIMASVRLVQGHTLKPADLLAFLDDKLERFAIPRYVRFVTEFPMTSTHRIIKKELEALGVTPDTFDARKTG